jgi:hypothetical protein
MMAQLQDLPPGRPPNPSDPQIEALQAQLRQSQNELEQARQEKELRQILDSVLRTTAAKKNST